MLALTDNPNYLVSIRKGSGGGASNISANVQAKLSININNQWVNILQALGFSGDSGGVGGAIGNALNGLQLFTGNNFLPEFATSHVWRGSNGLEIQLLMRFDAVNSAENDVMNPIKELVGLYMPTRDGGSLGEWAGGILKTIFPAGAAILANNNAFLHPPGPTPYEYITNAAADKLITVTIGNMLVITGLIPTNIAYECENRFTAGGSPVSAQATCNFISYVTPSKADVLNYFKGNNTSVNIP